jgi:hypothetical protein
MGLITGIVRFGANLLLLQPGVAAAAVFDDRLLIT